MLEAFFISLVFTKVLNNVPSKALIAPLPATILPGTLILPDTISIS